MAVTHWYTGEASQTTACIVVRSDTIESVNVTVNGVTQVATCDINVNDGNFRINFTGLTPNTRYAYTINGAQSGYVKTFPESGEHPFWLAYSSCWSIQSVDTLALQLLKAPATGATKILHEELVNNLSAFFLMGDQLYMNSSGTVNGYPLSIIDDGGTLANAKSLPVRLNYYRASQLSKGRMELMRNIPTYILKDDHEYDPDNASYDVDWLDYNYPATAPHSQTDLDDVWLSATTAWRNWSLGNPSREVTGSILSGPDCYKVRIGNTVNICTDMIHERSYIGAVDNSSKYIISSTQENWLLDTLSTTDATFKIWVSTKQFISSCGRNSDGFTDLGGLGEGYMTQLTRILNDVRFPRSATLSVTGDEHIKSDMFVESNRFDTNHAPISQISAGPASIDVITDPNDGLSYRNGVRYKERDISTLEEHGENTYVLLRVLSNRIERYVLGSRYGLRYAGYVGLDDNNIIH